MGSEIELTSEVGIGSTFSFELDLEPGQQSTGQRSSGARYGNVLVVEDNEVNSIVIASILEDNGCTVRCAAGGQEALELLRDHRFDVVFMDIHMPGLDGIDTARELRALESRDDSRTPIVAVTASVLPGDESRCREAGMDGFIRKPINDRVIAEALARFAN